MTKKYVKNFEGFLNESKLNEAYTALDLAIDLEEFVDSNEMQEILSNDKLNKEVTKTKDFKKLVKEWNKGIYEDDPATALTYIENIIDDINNPKMSSNKRPEIESMTLDVDGKNVILTYKDFPDNNFGGDGSRKAMEDAMANLQIYPKNWRIITVKYKES